MAKNRPNHDHRPLGDAEGLAWSIAEAVDHAWHREYAHGDSPRFPLSVVAALALLNVPLTDHTRIKRELLGMSPDELVEVVRAQWAIFIRYRPDLVNRAWPLISVWWSDERQPTTKDRAVAKSIADAAIRAGLLTLTGTARRTEVDLFGVVLPMLRSKSAITALGQFPTPPGVANLLAGLVGPPKNGQRVHEPTAGTGGLFRAAAEAMRAAGRDPTTVQWFGMDIDELSIACLAVNAVLWDLGSTVILGVGDVLRNPGWSRALAERSETLRIARFADAANKAMTLLGELDTPTGDPNAHGDQPDQPDPESAGHYSPETSTPSRDGADTPDDPTA